MERHGRIWKDMDGNGWKWMDVDGGGWMSGRRMGMDVWMEWMREREHTHTHTRTDTHGAPARQVAPNAGDARNAENRSFQNRWRCSQCSRVAAYLQCFEPPPTRAPTGAPGGDDAPKVLNMQTMRGAEGKAKARAPLRDIAHQKARINQASAGVACVFPATAPCDLQGRRQRRKVFQVSSFSPLHIPSCRPWSPHLTPHCHPLCCPFKKKWGLERAGMAM